MLHAGWLVQDQAYGSLPEHLPFAAALLHAGAYYPFALAMPSGPANNPDALNDWNVFGCHSQ